MRLRAPAEVRARVPGERVLAWMPSGTSFLVATGSGLTLPDGEHEGLRVSWDLILAWERRGARGTDSYFPVGVERKYRRRGG